MRLLQAQRFAQGRRRPAGEELEQRVQPRFSGGDVPDGLFLGQGHEQQGEDHQGKRRHLKHLGGNGRHPRLEVDTHDLQEGEEIGSDGNLERAPAAENHQGQSDPACAFGPLGAIPTEWIKETSLSVHRSLPQV